MWYILFFLSAFYSLPLFSSQKAVVVVPVAELVGQPMKSWYPNGDCCASYSSIPFCSGNNGITCPRLHQLLMHEQVEILDEKDSEVYIRVPNTFFVSHDKQTAHQEFWTLKKYFISFDTLKQHKVPITYFPNPIERTNTTQSPQAIVTLKNPFFNRITQQYFSAGTRFVQDIRHKNAKDLLVYVFDPRAYQFSTMRLPKNICITQTSHDKKKCTDLFVQILKEWAHQKEPYVIPYVLGGCSFITTHPAYQFPLTPVPNKNNRPANAYTYTKAVRPYGFDCAGLILRAAQMAGIPYFCKNTTAIAKTLNPLRPHEKLMNGDLLLIPGHVMIVADIKKNTLIEARGYDHGYGKVHEIPLAEQFKDMHTFQDLINAYRSKKPLVRLNKRGEITKTIANYTLFTLASVWNT